MSETVKIFDKQDMQLAAAVQAALLNGDLPQCRCGRMVLKNRMSGEVGGDFYHFHQLCQDQVIFAIGDVEGHGMGAALLMTLILGQLRADRKDLRRPSQFVAGINDLLVRLGEQINTPITCSMIYGILDLPSGILLYVNAGHPHPIICNRDDAGVRHLPPTTMLLGVQPGVTDESCHQFRQRDRLVLFTDGIVDAANIERQPFTIERLRGTVKEYAPENPEKLADRVLADVQEYCRDDNPQDDQTLVIIDFDNVSGS